MRVYLSSTLNDLGPERQAVKDALSGECAVVESYTADERSVRDSCLADVASCDVYIGIVGRRYGFIPPGASYSITVLEYEKAREEGRPVFIFIKCDSAIPFELTDSYEKLNPELIDDFRKLVGSGANDTSRITYFKTPEDLKTKVIQAFFSYFKRHAQPLPKRIEGEPYPGLRAFRPEESDRFFGRDVEIDDLIERLLVRNDRFIAVIGPSGSGKSSLVYAGLIPMLNQSHAGGMRWFSVSFSPRKLGEDPLLPLANALSEAFPDRGWRAPDLSQRLRANPASITTIAQEALQPQGTNAQLLLFADQFEELFAAAVDVSAREAFFRLLATAAASPWLRIVVAMRSDFYSQWPQDEASSALLRSGHYSVGTPGAAALEKMIVEPAKAAGLTIAPKLVQRILADTGTAPGALALTEFVLAQLYARRNGNELIEAAYQAIGGIAGAINGLAEAAVSRTKQDTNLDDETFSRLFLAIASVEQRSSEADSALTVVRRRAQQQEFSESALVLARHLADQRILLTDRDINDQPTYEVGHEAVFSHWQRFKDWQANYAGDLALRRQAEQAAHEWDNQQRLPILQWGWERQRPAILALAQLHRLTAPAFDANFDDTAIVMWRQLKSHLEASLRQFLYPEPLRLLDELKTDATTHQRREEIGSRLNQMGDPRRGVGLDHDGLPDIAWIDIPAGEITLETSDHFQFPCFCVARYPVTWVQYRAFVDAVDGYHNDAWWQDLERKGNPGDLRWAFDNYPAINVSWFDAVAFCRWLSAKRNLVIRLPAEWEWQWAAIGNTRQGYPWGNQWHPARANTDEAGIGRTVATGLYPLSRSPFGIDDMAGNVWQWSLNTRGQLKEIAGDQAHVVRGGSWSNHPGYARVSACFNVFPDFRYDNIGFRVLCEPSSDEKLSTSSLNAEKPMC